MCVCVCVCPLHRLTEELTKQESDLTQAQSNLTDLTLQRDACQEAGEALGREGIQSYVLEGVLKDLEAKYVVHAHTRGHVQACVVSVPAWVSGEHGVFEDVQMTECACVSCRYV